MSLIKQGLRVLFLPVFYVFSFLCFHSDWSLKQFLYDRKEKKFIFKQMLITIYDKRLGKKGSWISYASKFKNKPAFPHGTYGIFVSGGAKIGCNCVIYQQVTIGSNTLRGNPHFGSPTIGDNVLIGAGAKIIGKVIIGNNVRIGANAVVARDVPDNCVVVNQGKVIQKEEYLDDRFFTFVDKWYYYQDGIFVADEEMNNSILKKTI